MPIKCIINGDSDSGFLKCKCLVLSWYFCMCVRSTRDVNSISVLKLSRLLSCLQPIIEIKAK